MSASREEPKNTRTGSRPRAGVLCVTSGWFRDVGLQASDSATTAAVDRVAARLRDRLSSFAEPVGGSVLCSVPEAETAGREIQAADVDAVLLAPLMWCEDAVARAALKVLAGKPVILWSFSPGPSLPDFVPFQTMIQGSGPVAAMQLSGMLKREGTPFRAVAGHLEDDAVWLEIKASVRAHMVARHLRGARIGVLPFPCDQMSATWVDEFELRRLHGIELKWLTLESVRQAAHACASAEVASMRAELARRDVAFKVDDRNLEEGIRYALALEKTAAAQGLAGIAMNDVIAEMHSSFGLRPCLWNPRLSASGVVVSMEADVAACIAMAALRLLTDEPVFYTEPLSADYTNNAVLMGHAGYHDAACAEPGSSLSAVSDAEYERSDPFSGAAIFFRYQSGPVIAVNSAWTGSSLQWTCLEGESLSGPARMEGNCHLVLKPSLPVAEFFRKAMEGGGSQHWIIARGCRAREVEVLCGALGVAYRPL